MIILKNQRYNIKILSSVLLISSILFFTNCSKPKVDPEPPIKRTGTIEDFTGVKNTYEQEARDSITGTVYSISVTDTTIITVRTLNMPPPGPTLTRIFDPEGKRMIRHITMPNGKSWIDNIFIEGKTNSEIYDIKKCVEWEYIGEMFEITSDSTLLKLQQLYDSCD